MRNIRARGVKNGRPVFSEAIETMKVAHWLRFNKINFCHVPNGELRDIRVARRLKLMGVERGVSDFIIFDPPRCKQHYCGTALELKALDGKPPTEAQIKFLDMLRAHGWLATWLYGAEDAIKWLEQWYGPQSERERARS